MASKIIADELNIIESSPELTVLDTIINTHADDMESSIANAWQAVRGNRFIYYFIRNIGFSMFIANPA